MQKYAEIFNGELGTIKTFQAELQVRKEGFSIPDQSNMQLRYILLKN